MAVEETLKEVKTYKIMSSCKKRAQGTPTEMLKRGWEEYNTLFDDHLQQWTAGLLTPEQLAQSVIQSAQRLQPCSSDSWSENLREKVPSLLAGIFALFTIIRSGDAFMRHASASNVTAESGRESNASSAFAPKDLLIKPHSIQLLALLRLMGYGEAGSKLQNHVMQIPTGEGKSIALGGCVCYSEYLSKRDWNAFRDVFIALKVDKDIVYSTVTTYSTGEDLILRKGDIRSLTLDLVQGQELNGGGLPTAASPSDNAAEAGKKRGIKATQPPAKKTKVNAARQRKRKMADEEQVPSACSAVVPHAATAVVSADALTPAVHAQASPAAPKEEILIVDEVDVFFGENFYGRTHNQVATLAAPEIAELFHKLWESRNERDCPQVLFQSMKGTTAFTKLLQLFPDCADVLTSELKAMCLDLKDFDFQSADYIFEDGKIGYKILDGICWNVVHGYHTAFAYLHEAGKGNIRDSDLVLDKALQLRIPCARFSYAGMKCHRILGVSGTIHHLGKHQTDIMQRYGIKSYTCMPSVYGEKRFEFLSCTGAVPIKISADKNHIFDIVTEAQRMMVANKVIGQGRAVLVFFKSVDHLAQFEKSPYFSTIPGKRNVLRPNLPDKVKEDVIKKAATPHQATFVGLTELPCATCGMLWLRLMLRDHSKSSQPKLLNYVSLLAHTATMSELLAPAIFGRGTDFCCLLAWGCRAGGVHVIQAFFAQDRSEEIQIQGRTGLGLDPAELRGLTPPKLYQTLCDSRDQQQETQSAEMEERLKEASALDSRSHEYFDLLLAGRRNAAKASLSQLYRSIGCVGGASEGYHIVCCYDESGSMNGDSWTELVAAHASCMHKFAAMDHICISIVQFAEEARVVFPLGKVTDAPVDLQMVGGGPTHYTPALKKARRLMRDGTQSHAGLVPVLLFMSDGVSHDGAPVQLIQQMQNEFPEMVLHTVIFRCPDSEQLRRMAAAATEGQGHFHASADGVELMQTFSAIASGLEFTGRK
ncbi:unnamed protein product [Symbiodinium sp. CCMP2592]|nr:unnamed protein product [Symbiodinium sp. CCMP2592]